MPESGEQPKKRGGCGSWIAGGLAVLVVLYWMGSNQQEADKAKASAARAEAAADPTAALTVKPEELRAAYDANEASAQARYGKQVLRVEGKVDKITLDLGDDPVIYLATANEYDPVHANLAEEAKGAASGLIKGQEITLVCSDISEVVGTPILKDCVPAR